MFLSTQPGLHCEINFTSCQYVSVNRKVAVLSDVHNLLFIALHCCCPNFSWISFLTMALSEFSDFFWHLTRLEYDSETSHWCFVGFWRTQKRETRKEAKFHSLVRRASGVILEGEVFSALKGAGGRNWVSVSLEYKAERGVRPKFWDMRPHG